MSADREQEFFFDITGSVKELEDISCTNLRLTEYHDDKGFFPQEREYRNQDNILHRAKLRAKEKELREDWQSAYRNRMLDQISR